MKQQQMERELAATIYRAMTGKFEGHSFDVMYRAEVPDFTAIQCGADWPGGRILRNVDISDYLPDGNLSDYTEDEFVGVLVDGGAFAGIEF